MERRYLSRSPLSSTASRVSLVIALALSLYVWHLWSTKDIVPVTLLHAGSADASLSIDLTLSDHSATGLAYLDPFRYEFRFVTDRAGTVEIDGSAAVLMPTELARQV